MPQPASWAGTPSIKGSSESVRMALLTVCMIGLQFTWGIEMTYCTPYLLQLGLTKSRTSLVWIAGPLSGLIMQPVVGVIADRSRSRWGRRRPFMVVGAVIVGICLLVLGWTAEIVGLFVDDLTTRKSATIVLAVLSIYAVDFAINAVQASCRSLIVDTLPVKKQQLGSAWASRMVAIGHLIGYATGTINLVKIFGKTLGDTQFKQLCIISATTLLLTVCITSYSVEERILITRSEADADGGGVFKVLSRIFKTTLHLPNRMRAICWIQFWSWIGWFPFLFYSTTWVGETYFRYDATLDSASDDTLGQMGRVGSFSLVIFSSVSLLGSVTLPWLVRAPDDEKSRVRRRLSFSSSSSALSSFLSVVQRFQPDLLAVWTFSHFMFSSSMILAPFARSVKFATAIVAICGIPWALSTWAPFTYLGIEINKMGSDASGFLGGSGGAAVYQLISHDSDAVDLELTSECVADGVDGGDDGGGGRPNGLSSGHNHHAPHLNNNNNTDNNASTDEPLSRQPNHQHHNHLLQLHHPPQPITSPDPDGPSSQTGELAGVYLGILNLFTTLPQFVGTFISTIVFAVLEPGKSPELAKGAPPHEHHPTHGPDAIAVCLFIGALSTLVAAYATTRLRYIH